MTKPDWKDAPEWAQWMAQDWNGDWYWYENEPKMSVAVWVDRGGKHEQAVSNDVPRWEESLEQRPAVQP